MEVIERVRLAGGGVFFCNVTPATGKTFGIMGLFNTSRLYDAEAEAIASIGS